MKELVLREAAQVSGGNTQHGTDHWEWDGEKWILCEEPFCGNYINGDLHPDPGGGGGLGYFHEGSAAGPEGNYFSWQEPDRATFDDAVLDEFREGDLATGVGQFVNEFGVIVGESVDGFFDGLIEAGQELLDPNTEERIDQYEDYGFPGGNYNEPNGG